MKLTSIKLVTVIAPRRLKKKILTLFKQAGISGYTVFEAGGNRSLGGGSQIPPAERSNIQIEVLTEPILAHTLMLELAQKYFNKEKGILFEQDVRVMRPEKFQRRKGFQSERPQPVR